MPEAKTIRWWKNGDHPEVEPNDSDHPHDICIECGQAFGVHGRAGKTLVHPGDMVTVNKIKKGSGRGYVVTHLDHHANALRTLASD